MQKSYASIIDLHKDICLKNIRLFYALDRQILSLNVKKIKESKKDFAVKLNPYYVFKKA